MTIDKKTLAAQQAYVKSQNDNGAELKVVVPGAFVRGVRDLGYKDNSKALAELVDNSWEAGATRVDIGYGFEGTKSKTKPAQIVVIDDGCGMMPEMIRHAVRWGGTHREGSTTGLGKYGFGLPASCVSMGTRFTVFAKLEGGELHSVTVDLEEIEKQGALYEIPQPSPTALPKFVETMMENREWVSGTVVMIENLDRLEKSTAKGLTEGLLLNHMGVTYHSLRKNFNIYVDGKFVEPIDPLFLTPGARYYDLDADRATALDPMTFSVVDQDTRKPIGQLRVRFAFFPPHFGFNDKKKPSTGKGNINPRFHVINQYTGIIVSRMGRVIDVVTAPKIPGLSRFSNNDKYFGIELEFDAALDREFGITTAKQQVTFSDRIWELLAKEGFGAIVTSLRKMYTNSAQEWKASLQEGAQGGEKSSARIMSEAKKMFRSPSEAIQEKQQEKGEKNAQKLAETRAAESGRTTDEELKNIQLERKGKLFDVQYDKSPGAPFFRMEIIGGSKVLFINKAHRFYSDVYMGPESSVRLRSAIELLLFAIGDSMEDASDEAFRLYMVELPVWSSKLEMALDFLSREDSIEDQLEVEAAAEEASAA